MENVLIEYLGATEKEDTIVGSRRVWSPGQQRGMPSDVAAKLLFYPDTWRAVGLDAPEPVKPEPEKVKETEVFVAVNLHEMSKSELVNYGHTKFGVKLDKALTAENLRGKLLALQTDRQDD